MKFLNRSSVGLISEKETNTLYASCILPKPMQKIARTNSCHPTLVLRSILVLIFAWPVFALGQQVIFTSGGASYTNTKSRTFNSYGPVTVQCSSINFTLSFNFSRPWAGSGNMESPDECPSAGGCGGDPEDPDSGGCANCWDFIWVRLFVNGDEVFSDLIGAGKNLQTGVISTSGIPTNPGDQVSIEVYTQTWAADESITFNNIRITGAPAPVELLPLMDPYCQTRGNVSLTPSQNGIAGTWSGPGVTGTNFNTNTAGPGTHTLTFTPAANQCATPNTLQVEVVPAGPAELDALGPFCQNTGTINLPTNQNGVTGNWSGTGVSGNRLNTATMGSRILTFTPSAGQCATPNTQEVSIDPAGPAALDEIGPFCQNTGNVSLPTTTQSGISGNWSGAGVSGNRLNTSTVGPKNLTFTPGAGQCATATMTTVEVVSPTMPNFTNLGPYCQGQGTVRLPSTDENGIAGTWTGTGVSGGVNLNTGVGGTGNRTLRFTPGAGQCASFRDFVVSIQAPSAITVTNPGPFCVSTTSVPLNTTQGGQVGNWSGTGVSGNRLNISTAGNKNITFTPTDPCFAPATITVVVGNSANLNPIANQTICGNSFTLPPITSANTLDGSQAYFTGTNGTGTRFAPGSTVSGNQTLFAYYNAGGCSDQKSFTITFQTPPKIDSIRDTTICGPLTLPVITGTGLTDAAYYTQTMGGGTRFNPGQVVDTSQTLFVYDNNGTCSDQDTFKINIVSQIRLDSIPDVQVCSDYVLPTLTGTALSGNQAYYTEPNGAGAKYLPGQRVVGDVRLYAFDQVPGCSSERTFLLDTISPPILDAMGDTTVCERFILPAITGQGLSNNAAYYTQSLGAGTRFNPGQSINSSQTLFVYDGTADCFDQDTFRVTIAMRPQLDTIVDVQVCNAYTLPPIQGANRSGNEAYYTAPNGGGTKYLPGQMLTGDLRLYVFDQIAGCTTERSFLLDTLSPPQIDSLPDTTACGSMQLPLITGRNLSPNVAYFTGANGTGTRFAPGQSINSSTNLFVFDQKGNCSTERIYRITVAPGPQVQLLIAQPISCNGSNDGALDLQVSNSIPPVNFRWSQSSLDGIEDPQNLGPGTYTVTVTDGTACEVIASVTLNEPSPISLNCAESKAVSRVAGSDGEASISIGGGTARYSLTLSGPVSQDRQNLSAGTLSFTGLSAGNYKVVLTDSAGCTDSCQFTLTEPICNLTVGTTLRNPACFGDANGQISVNTTGGVFPFRIDWDQDALDGQLMPQNLRAGLYRFTIEDNVGCQIRDSVRLRDPAPLVLSCAQQSAVTRVGGNDGRGTLSLSGGTRPYRVSWTGPSSGSATINRTGDTTLTGLRSGQYRIELRDQNDCVDSCVLTISEPVCNVQASINVVRRILCTGNDDGSLEAIVRNGRAPVTYAWSSGAGMASTSSIQNLGPGLYTLVVTDNSGCKDTAQFDLIEPAPLVANCEVVRNVSTVGGSDGQVKLRYSGGTGVIALDWGGSQPGSVIASSRDSLYLGNLAPGTYSPRFIDANGCPETCAFNINEPVCDLSARLQPQDPACPGASNGQIVAVVDAGAAPFTFQWSNNSTNDTLQNVGAGNYQVTITDAINCSVVLDTILSDPATLNVTCQVTQQVRTVNGSEGRVRLTFSGGSPDYTIILRGPVTTSRTENASGTIEITGLSSGDYTVIFTDSKGCEDSCSFRVTEPNCTLVVQSQASNPLCNADATGEIAVSVTGGKTPFQYDWSDDANDGQAIARRLQAGTYSVAVTDSVGCVGVDTIVLVAPAPLSLACGTPVSTTTVGGQNGYISVRFSGGTGPYKLILSGSKRDSFLNISVDSFRVNNLSKGNYLLSLTDANGCTIQGCDFQIEDPICTLSLSLNPTNNQCAGASQGSIQSTLAGGLAPFTYDWSDDRFDGNAQASGLRSGTYQLIVTDAQFCRDTASVALTDPLALETVCSVLEQPRTLDGTEGRARVVIRGGTGQRNIQLSGPSPGQMQQSSVDTFSFSNLAAGIYQVVVSDANGCADTCGFTIEPFVCKLQVSAQSTSPRCNGDANGSIQLTVVGNAGNLNYAWNSPLPATNLNALPAGTYRVTVSDAAGCRDSVEISIAEPPAINFSVSVLTQPSAANPQGGSIRADYSGGVPRYSLAYYYQQITVSGRMPISGGGPGFTTIPNLQEGNYIVIINDSNNCRDTAQITLTAPPCNLTVNITSARADCESSHLNTTITGGTGPFQYSWNPNRFNGQANPRNATPGTYRLTVTDAVGCVAQDSIVIAADPLALQVDFGVINPPCPGNFGVFNIRSIGGGQGPFILTLGARNPQRFNTPPLSIRDLNPGTFNLNITNSSGCSFDTSITITAPQNLSLELGQDTTLRRGAKITFRPSVNFDPVQINWSPSEGLTGAETLNPQATPNFTTTYTLLLSDSSGCEVSDKIRVLVAGQVEAYFPTAFSPNGDDINDYFTAFANDEDIEMLEYLRIFDRWGDLVFEGINVPLNDPSKGWDGTSRGQPSPIGLYVYSSVVRLKNGSTYQKAGEVNLIR